jgi:hypothetical protein
MTAIKTYQEALYFLRSAEEALDQAHAQLRDLGLDKYIDTCCGQMYRNHNVGSAHAIVEGLIENLTEVECPECGKPMAENEACLAGRCPSIPKGEDYYDWDRINDERRIA